MGLVFCQPCGVVPVHRAGDNGILWPTGTHTHTGGEGSNASRSSTTNSSRHKNTVRAALVCRAHGCWLVTMYVMKCTHEVCGGLGGLTRL